MEIDILNVRLPSDVVKWLDSMVKKGIYNSRSEAIREYCREYVLSNKKGDASE
jgi:Arc/MetJ-type ribon-helix-helix transcriptional regulator